MANVALVGVQVHEGGAIVIEFESDEKPVDIGGPVFMPRHTVVIQADNERWGQALADALSEIEQVVEDVIDKHPAAPAYEPPEEDDEGGVTLSG